jgi:hypothetical protein
MDPGGSGTLARLFGAWLWFPPLETARRGRNGFGRIEREGTVGAGSDAGPHYFWAVVAFFNHAAGM